MDKQALLKTANEVRKGILTAVHSAKSGHPGGSLSAADIFTYLYFEEIECGSERSKEGRQRSFCTFKGTYSSGSVLYTGTEEDTSR